jgi:hypothetical protein
MKTQLKEIAQEEGLVVSEEYRQLLEQTPYISSKLKLGP